MARSGLTSKHRDLWLAALVYASVSLIYAACAPTRLWLAHTPYNHFAWLADAMLHGRLCLEGPPPAYAGGNDFAQFEHRWFVVFPPFPALLLLPLVALCKHVDSVRDGIFFLLLAGLGPVGIFVAIQRLRQARLSMLSENGSLFLSGLFALGTVYFFTSVQGTVWFTAHVVATTAIAFFAAASIEAKYPFLAGLALSAAIATRSHLAFSGIFFVFEAFRINQKPRMGLGNYDFARISRQLALFAAPCIVTSLCLLYYNWARFHDPFEVGYRYLQIAWQPRITRWGMFSYHYLARNLGIVFTSLPYVNPSDIQPKLQINAHGLALWVTSPFYLWLLWPKTRSPLRLGCYVTLLAAALPSLLYQNSGWIQFGQRFSNDYSPWLFVLLAIGLERFGRAFKVAATWAVAANLFGALTFQRTGWNAYYYIEGSQKIIYQPD